MRRLLCIMVALCSIVTLTPGAAMASSKHDVRGPRLINAYQRQLLGTAENDPWLFDDGCIGGATHDDPAFMLVPLTDIPTTTSNCTISRRATLVIVPDGFTCVQPTLEAARDECETAWADPAQALQMNSVVVDGKARHPKRSRVSGDFTFPAGSLLDEPGRSAVYYAITDAVTLHDLRPGVHTVFVSYRYADGLNGATTFTLTVTR